MPTKKSASGRGKIKPDAFVIPIPGKHPPKPPGKPKEPPKKKGPIASKPAPPIKSSGAKGKTGSVYKKTKTKSAAV